MGNTQAIALPTLFLVRQQAISCVLVQHLANIEYLGLKYFARAYCYPIVMFS